MKHLKSTFVGLLALTAASDAFAQGPPGPPPMGGGLPAPPMGVAYRVFRAVACRVSRAWPTESPGGWPHGRQVTGSLAGRGTLYPGSRPRGKCLREYRGMTLPDDSNIKRCRSRSDCRARLATRTRPVAVVRPLAAFFNLDQRQKLKRVRSCLARPCCSESRHLAPAVPVSPTTPRR